MENYVVAIELSSKGIAVVAARCDAQQNFGLEIKVSEFRSTEGAVKRGTVVNPEVVKRSLSDLLLTKGMPRAAEGKANVYYVMNINGNAFRTALCEARVGVPAMVNEAVEKGLIFAAQKNAMRRDSEEILGLVPRYYQIDDMRNVATLDYGTKCASVTGCYTALFGNSERIAALRPLLGNRKLEKVYSTTASKAAVLLTNEQKNNNVALIDFGATTTNVAVYVKGVLHFEVSVPLGSDLITADVARGLDVLPEYAEILKCAYGIEPDEALDEKHITPTFPDGTKLDKRVLINDIKFFARARTEELISYIDSALQKSDVRDRIKRFAITGGGAKLKGIDKLAQQMLGKAVDLVAFADPDDELRACAMGMASRFSREMESQFAPRGEQQSLFDNDELPVAERPEVSGAKHPKPEKKSNTLGWIKKKIGDALNGEEGETMTD